MQGEIHFPAPHSVDNIYYGGVVAVTVGVEVPVAVGVTVRGTLVAVTVAVLVKVGGTPVAVAVGVADGVTRFEGRSMRGATQTALSFTGEPFESTVRMNFTWFPASGLKSVSTV
jgi:hypothetical protein